MKLQERSYNSKILRPKPLIHSEEDGSVLVIATAWGKQDGIQRIVDDIMKYIVAAKADVEATSPFPFLSCLPDEVNYVRTALMLANDSLYRSENKNSYSVGLEILVLYKKDHQLSWAHVGAPSILVKREGKAVQPLSMAVDLSSEMSSLNGFLPPMPTQLLGLEPTCDIKVGHTFLAEQDQVFLVAASELAQTLWTQNVQELGFKDFSQSMTSENPDAPFWLGLVTFP